MTARLNRLGDPERVGAKLPLWVLIDPKGAVVHYKVGNYPIKADEGLSELDQAILDTDQTAKGSQSRLIE